MNLSKRDFLQVMGAASVAGMGLSRWSSADAATASAGLYDVPRFGNVSLLHFTDCHAQLKPVYFREPNMNLGVADMKGRLPHLVGEHLLKAAQVPAGTPAAHALTYLNFDEAARRYGRVGGFAHLATLVKRMKASRPGSLLLDGGDTWQGSATALWTKGQDMVDACKLLGVDVMTGHWEFTLGMERVKEIIEKDFAGKVDFVAQNIKTNDFGDPVFAPYVIREINGVPVAIIGQAFPYTPIANPRYMVADWAFGIQDENMQTMVDEARGKGAQVVVVLSHNGMDVDLKMASRVTGIDAIMGGHTHDGMPVASIVVNKSGKTLVTNAGSNGKFLSVMDFEVKNKQVVDFRYHLLPVFANMLPADPAMDALITKIRSPYEAKLAEKLATTEGTLYRRGNFNGSGDQLLLDALMDVQGGPGDHARMAHGHDRNDLLLRHGHRHVGRDDQDHPRGCGRQPVQPGPVLPARRRHGARGRPALFDRPDRQDGAAHWRHAPERQAHRSNAHLQGCRLGARGRRGQPCRQQARLGTGGAVAGLARRQGVGAPAQPAPPDRRPAQSWLRRLRKAI
jgi:sulfur-oxidizing protein SoxB